MNKVIIDGQQGANGVVPYLPLPELAAAARSSRRSAEQRPAAASSTACRAAAQ